MTDTTADDLKRMQDRFIRTSKELLMESGRLRPIGFVITLQKHVDKLFESGWGVEFLDPKACLRDTQNDHIAVLIVDLAMDWERLYHAVLNVFPQTRDILPKMIELGRVVDVDDAHMRVMRAFLKATEMDEKDVASAVMRQICDKVDAFACVLHAEAWMRFVAPSETLDEVYAKSPQGLKQDQKSVEVVMSSMETHDFTRMVTVPIHRAPSKDPAQRDGGKVTGFGDPVDTLIEDSTVRGRLAGLLKPLKEAS